MTVLLLLGVPIEFLTNLTVFLVSGLQDQLTGSVKSIYQVAVAEQKAKRQRHTVALAYRDHARRSSYV